MTLGTALRQGTELLARGGILAPRLTAEVLLGHAVKCEISYLYAYPERELREVEWIHYGRYLHERLQHKPTQYITGTQEFYGRSFHVNPSVLIPRPETEHVVERVLALDMWAGTTIDVGTGSGVLAVTLALERAVRVVALDCSAEALSVARRNADALGARVDFLRADALSAFAERSAGLIVSNPPYVALADRQTLEPEVRDWEPEQALFAGADGLAFFRRLIPQAARVLRPGGSLVLELGAAQGAAVSGLLGAEWQPPDLTRDLAGIDRVLHARKISSVLGTFSGTRSHSHQ